MAATVERNLEDALALPDDARLLLAERLVESVDTSANPEIEARHLAEVRRRMADVRDEQFAAQGPAGPQFPALDEPIHTEVIHPEHVGRFLDRIGKPLRRGGRLRNFWSGFHAGTAQRNGFSGMHSAESTRRGRSSPGGGFSFLGSMYFPSVSSTGTLPSIRGKRSPILTWNTDASQTSRKSCT